MERLQALALALPEAVRVDIEAWDDQPTFRVRNKNFVFTNQAVTTITVKLSQQEAAAVVATVPGAAPTGYGLGRHGWVTVALAPRLDDEAWAEVAEWVETSYTLVAPKALARRVLDRVVEAGD